MDIFEKELAIADATYEATVNRIVSMDSIESMYMTEASEDSDNFFKKLIQAIKDFFKKIKDAVSKKLVDMKAKQAIEKIKKEGIKEIKGVKAYDDFDKLAKQTQKKCVESFTKHVKNIYSAKDEKDIKKSYETFQKEQDEIWKQHKISWGNLRSSKNVSHDLQCYYGHQCDEIDAAATKCEEKLAEIGNKLAKDKSSVEGSEATITGDLLNAKQQAVKKAGTKVSSVFQKLGNTISRHKIATFVAACGILSTISSIQNAKADREYNEAVDKMREEHLEKRAKMRRELNEQQKEEWKKLNKERDKMLQEHKKRMDEIENSINSKFESVDDLLDEMISDLSGGGYDSVTESYDELPLTLEDCIMEAGALQKYIKTKEESLKGDKEKLARLKKQVDKMSGEAYKKGKEKVDALQRKISEGERIPCKNDDYVTFDDYRRGIKNANQTKGDVRKLSSTAKNGFKQATQGPTRKDPHDRAAGDRGHKTIPDKLKNINDKKAKQTKSEDLY